MGNPPYCFVPFRIPVNCDFTDFLAIGEDLKEGFLQSGGTVSQGGLVPASPTLASHKAQSLCPSAGELG